MAGRVPRAVILSQGDEVVTGQVVDTNAAWLAERLTTLGFDVVRHVTVGDRLPDLVSLFRRAVTEAEAVIGTGGLGPTQDDLTAEAVATAFDMPLALDEAALQHIRDLYARFGRPMPPTNRKQALLPEGSARLHNDRGTAPGFSLVTGASYLACMPGVPSEMRAMFERRVVPQLTERFALRPGRLVVLRTTGAGESTLQDRIGPFSHARIVLSYRTSPGENQVKLRVPADVPRAEVEAVVASLSERIGRPLFAVEGLHPADDGAPPSDLVGVIATVLQAHDATLAVAESCTGGAVAAACTARPGASAWFLEGAVTYSNAAKVARLGVDEALLAQHGAVSEPVARAMAEGIRRTAGATYGLSTTGIAGPGGGTPHKPVGTVHVALATPEGTQHRLLSLGGTRDRIQALTVAATLDLLRRHLLGPA